MLENLEAEKFDLAMRMFLRKTQQVLIERKIYEEVEKERKQAFSDRQILGEELEGLGAKLEEKENELRDLEEKYREMERKLGEEKLKNEECERMLREYEGEQGKLNELVGRATRMVEERKRE